MHYSKYIELSPEGENMVRESVRIPHSLNRIHISVKRPEEFEGAGFLAVFDEKQHLRLQKMIAYGEQELGIGEKACDTSAGCVAGEIGAGDWTILYGNLFTDWENYHGEFPVVVEITLSDEEKVLTEPLEQLWLTDADDFHISENLFAWGAVHNKKSAWFKGDFHTHTRLSDGKETMENAMKKAVDMQMDFYVPTEHNLVHTGWKNTNLLVLPGVEVTLPLGHYNIFGLTERPKQLDQVMLAKDKEEMAAAMLSIICDANRKNWLVSINHPFLHIWKWHLDEVLLAQIQCLEIVNDPTYPYAKDANEKAISFLDFLWNDGHRIYGVGGSDAHNLIEERYDGASEPSVAGDPGTYVYCEGLSAENLLQAAGAGHMVVTRYCRVIPHISDGERSYLPGDELTGSQITYAVSVTGIMEAPHIYLVTNSKNGQVEKELLPVEKTEDGDYRAAKMFPVDEESYRWFRMEIRDREGAFWGYINPVYSGKKEPDCHTFGEAKNEWIKEYGGVEDDERNFI